MTAAATADAFENPVTGERIEIREDVPGVLRFDYRLAPGGFSTGSLDHVHPHQVEQLRVRSGRLDVRVEDEEWTARAGDRFTIPANAAHSLRNESSEPVQATVELRPGLGLAAFFRTTFGLAREGRTNEWGIPSPLQLAVLVDAFGDQLRFTGVPRGVQLGTAALLAPVGRLLGHRARYPRFERPDGRATDEELAARR